MLKTLALAGAICCALFSSAEARQRHAATGLHPQCNILFPCQPPSESSPQARREARGRYIARSLGFGGPNISGRPHDVKRGRKAISEYRQRNNINHLGVTSYGAPSPSIGYTVSQVIGSRPSGCPHAYCGCGASLHLFGRIIPSLNLAANWLRFPRATPAPKMAAARRGHVMVLEEHIQGDVWLVHDSNSGHGLTRLHARSIAGYTIVNPRAG